MDEPVDWATLRAILRAALEDGTVSFGSHALDEMEDDDLTEQDCRNVLRGGQWDGCDFERGTWRYRVRTPRMVVVVAIASERSIRVVTAWRER